MCSGASWKQDNECKMTHAAKSKRTVYALFENLTASTGLSSIVSVDQAVALVEESARRDAGCVCLTGKRTLFKLEYRCEWFRGQASSLGVDGIRTVRFYRQYRARAFRRREGQEDPT